MSTKREQTMPAPMACRPCFQIPRTRDFQQIYSQGPIQQCVWRPHPTQEVAGYIGGPACTRNMKSNSAICALLKLCWKTVRVWNVTTATVRHRKPSIVPVMHLPLHLPRHSRPAAHSLPIADATPFIFVSTTGEFRAIFRECGA